MDNPIRDRAWRPARVVGTGSLPEVFRTVSIPARSAQWWKKLLAFFGPGYMVAVGYMDPGNWATDLAGGSKFAYSLLFVIMLSNAMAILLQALSAKLGIVAERDLAQACRESYSKPVNYALWLLCELAIVACDLAEVLGSAIALQLLFGLPMLAGVLVTVVDVLLLLLLQKRNVRWLESVVITLMATIAICFGVQLWWAGPDWMGVAGGLVPSTRLLTEPGMLLVAVGILGATVMPHNLYLHSAIVQTRRFERTPEGRKDAIRWATLDSTIALMVALFINAAILVLAAATFHRNGHTEVAEIQQAYQMLSPVLGAPIASTLFAVALLASGQNSTITGTLAGQIVMEGFLDIQLPGWVRRLVTRTLAIIPAVAVIAIYGEKGTGSLLILSQVVLSLQLSFAVFPLIRFTSDPVRMGEFANKPATRVAAYAVGFLIAALNVWLLVQTGRSWLGG